ncbi:MAG TPA: hypothetical protein PLZ36_12970 [Armatimonadota bacterium]|nr:hypothetical protein [Armatimonadota bacterium]
MTALIALLGIGMMCPPVNAAGGDPDQQVAQRVDEAFARLKTGDNGALAELDIHASLPYLPKYITDADPSVRGMLIPLARRSTSPGAVSILTALVVDEDVTKSAQRPFRHCMGGTASTTFGGGEARSSVTTCSA